MQGHYIWIWAGRLNAEHRKILRQPQRVIAVRVVIAYRTVSWAAAGILAGSSPWDLEAQVLAEAYRGRIEGRRRRRRREGAHNRGNHIGVSKVRPIGICGWSHLLPESGLWLDTMSAVQPKTWHNTLQECSAWIGKRQGVVSLIGGDLLLTHITLAMSVSERAWEAGGRSHRGHRRA